MSEIVTALAFSQNCNIFAMLERIAKGGATMNKYIIYNPESCHLANQEAELSLAQFRIIRPTIEVEATSNKEKLQDADIFIIPGISLPSKNDDQFSSISQKAIWDTFNGLALKEDCKFFICGSFRGLILANHLGDAIEENHMKNIEVLCPYVYTGLRMFDGEKAGDPVVYPHKDTVFTVINHQDLTEADKNKLMAVKFKVDGRPREPLDIQREALGHALQQYQSGNSFALVGKFPSLDEQQYYGIANFPVILPTDPNSTLKSEIKTAVKRLADQVSSVIPNESQSDSDSI